MVKIEARDYDALKGFFAWAADHLLPAAPGLAAEQRPIAILTALEAKSMARARQGLRMAIGDIVEMTENYSQQQIATIDRALTAGGLPTLSEVRARFWSKIAAILKRGAVRNETDYHALRNVIDTMTGDDNAAAWRLLAAYEQRATASAGSGGGQ